VLLTPDINLPGTLHQLAEFIRAYSILIDVLIGKDTPLAVVVREHYHYWCPAASEVMAAIAHESPAAQTAFRVGVMCLIKTEVGHNLSNLANPHLFGVGLPDLEFIVAAIWRRTFGIMPSLPAQYYGELGQVTDVAPTTANPPVAPAAQSDTS
jgi:hypothetical protein